MTVNLSRDDALLFLRQVMPGHKATGLVAQLEFEKWVKNHGSVQNKYFPGCWIVASKASDFYASRTCFFVYPEICSREELSLTIKKLEANAQFQRMCSALNSSGFTVLCCFSLAEGDPSVSAMTWEFVAYSNEKLAPVDQQKYFALWQGRGRESNPRAWRPEQEALVNTLDDKSLTALALPQLFYNGFFKRVYRAATVDPYDTDGFLVSYGGQFFPVELKQKSSFIHGTAGDALGLDAGRILMMLRICIPINANGFYIVRLVDDSTNRAFLDWKIIRLDEFLMKCTWNLQGGGPGMASSASGAGSATSTVIAPLSQFRSLKENEFSEDSLLEHSEMRASARKLASEFMANSKIKYGF